MPLWGSKLNTLGQPGLGPHTLNHELIKYQIENSRSKPETMLVLDVGTLARKHNGKHQEDRMAEAKSEY